MAKSVLYMSTSLELTRVLDAPGITHLRYLVTT